MVSYKHTPLWPLIFLFLVGCGWSVFVGLRFKKISWEQYQQFSYVAHQKRLYHESYWWYFHRGGLAILSGAAFIWGSFAVVLYYELADLTPAHVIITLFMTLSGPLLFYLGGKAFLLGRQQFLKRNSLNYQ
jgi:hypothetical protein